MGTTPKLLYSLLGLALFLVCAAVVQVWIAAWRDPDPAGRLLALTELLLSWKVLSAVVVAVIGPDAKSMLQAWACKLRGEKTTAK